MGYAPYSCMIVSQAQLGAARLQELNDYRHFYDISR